MGVLSPGATPCPHQKGHQNGEGEAWPCSDDTKHQTHSAGHTRPALTCSTAAGTALPGASRRDWPCSRTVFLGLWAARSVQSGRQSPSPIWPRAPRRGMGGGGEPAAHLSPPSPVRQPPGLQSALLFPWGLQASCTHSSSARGLRGGALRTTPHVANTNTLPATARQGQGRSGRSTPGLHVQETPLLGKGTVPGTPGTGRCGGSGDPAGPGTCTVGRATPGAGWGRGRASGGLSGLGLGKHRVAEVALAGALGIRLPDRGLRGRGAESGAGRRRARPGEARTVPTAPSPAPPCTSGSGSPWAALPAGGPPCRASSTCGWGLS